MKNPIPLLLGLLGLFAWGTANLWQSNCGCTTTAATTSIAPRAAAALAIADGSAFKADFADNLRFKQSNFAYAPYGQGLSDVFKRTADYLKANPSRAMRITGLYGDSERNTSIYENLGLGRANKVKNIFTELGVPTNQLFTEASKLTEPNFVQDTLIGGAAFSFFDLPKEDNRLAEIEKRLKGNPLTLYFETNQSEINLTEQQRKDCSDLEYYVTHKAGAKLISTGHTDNVGDPARNMALGQRRAAFIKDYLAKNGIGATLIDVESKGQAQPVADNTTTEGKAKNRRVTVGIK
jgi:OmpA-OmpF porin, OOP family